jgi:hypothetical protein
VSDLDVILVYSIPALLPLAAVFLVLGKRDWPRGPKVMLVISLLILAAAWVFDVAYWWENICWETWQPCQDSAAKAVANDVVLGSLGAVLVSLLWLAAARNRRVTNTSG